MAKCIRSLQVNWIAVLLQSLFVLLHNAQLSFAIRELIPNQQHGATCMLS